MKRIFKSLFISCLGGLVLSLSPLSNGQTALAVVIADDAGGKPEDYQNYADSLAETLKSLSPDELAAVFEGGTPSLATSKDEEEEAFQTVSAMSAARSIEEPPTVNLTPPYEAALDSLLAAQSSVDAAQAALDAALKQLQVVIKDEEGLIGDDVFGNFLTGIFGARRDVQKARDNLAAARENEIRAKAEFDKF